MTPLSALTMFLALLVGHALGDYPLQGDFLARAKNHTAPIPGVPWYQALTAHALIQAGIVALITSSPLVGFLEFVCPLADRLRQERWCLRLRRRSGAARHRQGDVGTHRRGAGYHMTSTPHGSPIPPDDEPTRYACNACVASSDTDDRLGRRVGRACPYCGEGVIQEVSDD